MDILYYVFAVLVFIAVALAVEAGWQWWFSSQSRAARRLKKRVRQVAGKPTSAERSGESSDLWKETRLSESPQLEQYLRRMPGVRQLNNYLRQAGAEWNVARHFAYTGLSFVIGFVLGLLLLRGASAALFFGLACASLPTVIVANKRSKRLLAIERQLPEAADLISRSLKAGHALPATLQMLGDELPEPISGEFRQVSDEIGFGATMIEALQRLAERVPLTDLRYMIVAIMIQREAGGNLSEVMTNVSLLIRQRLKLLGDVRTMSAEGRLSAVVLCLLPVVVAAVFMVTSPTYLQRFLDDPAGPAMLGFAVLLLAMGVLWMRQLIRIRV